MPEMTLSKNWWLVLLRGIVAILFSFLVFSRPGITLAALILAFGIYILVEGVAGITSAIRMRHQDEHWWVLLLEGLAAIAISLITLTSPGTTALVLLFYIATWAMITGVLRVVTAIRLRHEIKGEFWMIVGGIVSVAFGVLLLRYPGEGALAVLTYIGLWAMVTGVSLVLLSFRMRHLAKEIGTPMGGRPVQAPAH